jgi:oligopeptidase B
MRSAPSPVRDQLIYEETDPGFFMNVGGTRNNDWIMISHQRS